MPSLQFNITIHIRNFELFGKTTDYFHVRCPHCQVLNFYRPDKQDHINHFCCMGCQLTVDVEKILHSILTEAL